MCERCHNREKSPGKRFCRGCCKALLAEMKETGYLTPRPETEHRTDDARQAREFEPNPWQENAIRDLEEDR